MLHTVTVRNPHFEGDVMHGLVHFHKGTAMVDDELTVEYDTAEGRGDGAVLQPKAYNVLELLIAQGAQDLGALYGQAAQAALGALPRDA